MADRRRRRGLRLLVRWLLGPDSDTLKQQQLILIVTSFVFLLLSALFNGLFGITPFLLVAIYVAALPVFGGLWWQGRWRDRTSEATAISLAILALVVAPATWFLNAGSQGPTLILYLVLVSYAVGVQSVWVRWRAGSLILLLVSPVVCLLLEMWVPHWVTPYPDTFTRLIDLVFSYSAGAMLLIIVILGHVRRFNQELYKANVLSKRLTDMARKDSLTGLLNHKVIHQGVMAALAHQRPFSLIMLDLDHFKKVNDRHGHLYGDTVLVQFALVLRACCEPSKGQVGRAGGEEFLAIIPGPEEAANNFLSHLRTEWAICSLEHGAVTFSAGAASWVPGDSLNSLIQRADDALYGAKDGGRDRWVVSTASSGAGL
ncbi:GGDEF domain-containing protein [Saccharospirillum impatiens]|uniref:GGDEF domain-containing protein n=1 Tax=Saccharospirillum impatiens TaxID=169438 RepID=UPI00040AD7E0|nr:GGDEF domain-containing protein [Saccharospirillum impatiens]